MVTRLDMGGAQFNTVYTVTHLNKDIFDVYLLAGPNGTMQNIPDGTKVEFIPQLQRSINPVSDLKALLAIYKNIKKINPDIIHTHSSKAGILGRIAAYFARVPVIIHTFHGFGFHPLQNFLVRNTYILLEKICALFSSALIFVSESNIQYALSLGIGNLSGVGNLDKFHLIRSGIKLSDYPAKADKHLVRSDLGIKDDDILISSIGNTKPQKNPIHLIIAASNIISKLPLAKFVFVGGGSELEKYKKAVRDLNIEKNFIMTGWRSDGAQILAASDIYAMTSLWEGLPRSLVEAFATGIPAVCYRTDGVTDILKDGVNGFSVEKNDINGFTDYLTKVISDSTLRKKLASGAKNTDLKTFDIDYMVNQQEELYKNLITHQ